MIRNDVMKKKIFSIFVVAMSVFFLFSCMKEEPEPEVPTEQDIWNGGFVDQNITTENVTKEEETFVKNYFKSINFDEDVTILQTYLNLGLVVVANEYDQVGFYSLQYQTYLVAPQYQLQWIHNSNFVSTNDVDDIGFVINIYYEDVWVSYDSFGNKIFEGTTEPTFTTTFVNDKVYLKVFDEENATIKYYVYNEAAALEPVDMIPTQDDSDAEDSEFEDNLGFGDLFIGERLELDKFGLDGHYLLSSDNSIFTIFNASNTKVITFTLPENVSAFGIVGKNIIYQQTTVLPDEAEMYSLILQGKKYSNSVYLISVETGEITPVETEYLLLGNIIPYLNDQGQYLYGIASIGKIDDNKCVSDYHTYIIDETATLIQSLTGYKPLSFVKIGRNYYNYVTNIIYDSNLNEIAYIGDMNPQLIPEENMFIGTMKDEKGVNYYGAIDFNGKVIIPFEYVGLNYSNNLDFDVVDNWLIARKKDKDNNTLYYRVNISDGSRLFIGKNIEKLYNGLYLVKNTNNYELVNVKGTLYTYTFDENSINVSVGKHLSTNNVNELAYIYLTVTENYFEEAEDEIEYKKNIEYSTFVINEAGNASSFTTIGTEVTTENELGQDINEAIDLSLGENALHFTGDNVHKFEYTANEDGIYAFTSEEAFIIEEIINQYGVEVVLVPYEDKYTQTEGYLFELEENVSYMVSIRPVDDIETVLPTHLYLKADFRDTLGTLTENPYIYEMNSGVQEFDFKNRDKIYVEFNPHEAFSTDYSSHYVYNVSVTSGAFRIVSPKTSYDYFTNYTNQDVNSVIVEVTRVETTATTFTISVEPNLGETPVAGSSVYNAITLVTELPVTETPETPENTETPAEVYENEFDVDTDPLFVKYTNTTENIQMVTFTFGNLSQENVDYLVTLFNDEYEYTGQANVSALDTNGTTMSLLPGETVYFSLSVEADTTKAYINVDPITIEKFVNNLVVETEESVSVVYSYTANKTCYIDLKATENGTEVTLDSMTIINLANPSSPTTSIDSKISNFFVEKGTTYIIELVPVEDVNLDCSVKLTHNYVNVTSSINEELDAGITKYYHVTNNYNYPVTYNITLSEISNARLLDEDYSQIQSLSTSTNSLIIPAHTTYVISVTTYNSSYYNPKVLINNLLVSTSSEESFNLKSYDRDYVRFVAPSDGTYVFYTTGADRRISFSSPTIYSKYVGTDSLRYFLTAKFPENVVAWPYDVAYKLELTKGQVVTFSIDNNSSYSVEFDLFVNLLPETE